MILSDLSNMFLDIFIEWKSCFGHLSLPDEHKQARDQNSNYRGSKRTFTGLHNPHGSTKMQQASEVRIEAIVTSLQGA